MRQQVCATLTLKLSDLFWFANRLSCATPLMELLLLKLVFDLSSDGVVNFVSRSREAVENSEHDLREILFH